MAGSDWFVPLLLALGLATPFILGVLVALAIMGLRELRREVNSRLGELARRLRSVESRLDRLEGHDTESKSARTRKESARGTLPRAWRKEPPAATPGGPNLVEPRNSPTLIAVPALAVPSPGPDGHPEEELGERHLDILSLAAAGAPPGEIARQTGQPIGQVELILGLHRQIRSSRGPADHERAV